MTEKGADPAQTVLSSVSYFQGLGEATLRPLAQTAVYRDYTTGQLVILEGEPSFGLQIVERGWLKAVKIGLDGREQALQFLGPGEAFNVITVLTGAPHPASVIVLEESRVWSLRREAVLRLIEEQPVLARRIIEDLAGRIQHLIGLVEDLSLRTVEARLARMLLESAQGSRVHRQPWATQAEIASRLGTVPDVVNRALRKLSEEGVLSISRQTIEILDRPALEARAGREP